MGKRRPSVISLLLVSLAVIVGAADTSWPPPASAELPAGALSWREERGVAIRGLTVGPIENALHPGRDYGSEAFEKGLDEARAMGANWISLTPFGRLMDGRSTGIRPDFERPFADKQDSVKRAVAQAHARGLSVLLVPHLWVETGEWRGELDPGDAAGWERLEESYRQFLTSWAQLAESAGVDMLAVGVELRSWVTTARAASFVSLIRDVRAVYSGPITYAANWDDVHRTVILGELDVIGVNAFYPLAHEPNASLEQLRATARQRADQVEALARRWNKPVLFTEVGYTTRRDPALRPWEWPEALNDVVVDQRAQAQAFFALLAAFRDRPWFAGFFVWRVYSDPEDTSQEPDWGFSPRGKLAELVLRDAFATRWASDRGDRFGAALRSTAAERIGGYPALTAAGLDADPDRFGPGP